MSNPRYWWYSNVKRAVMHYPRYKDRQETEYQSYKEAIEKALEEVKTQPNSDNKLYAIDEVLFRQTRTIDGVSVKLNYSRGVVQSWITEFINLVGKYKGWKES